MKRNSNPRNIKIGRDTMPKIKHTQTQGIIYYGSLGSK